MKSIVVTSSALDLLSTVDFSLEDFVAGTISDQTSGNVVFSNQSENAILFTRSCSLDSRLLVIRLWQEGFFFAVPIEERRSVFDRCARIALQEFNRSVSLNPRWLPYHDGNKLSVFAYSYGRDEGKSQRVIAEINPQNTNHVYVFALETVAKALDLSLIHVDYEPFEDAVKAYAQALEEPLKAVATSSENHIELECIDDTGFDTRGFSYDEWVRRLSPKQKDFFERDLSQPIRLRGAAGTGKTSG